LVTDFVARNDAIAAGSDRAVAVAARSIDVCAVVTFFESGNQTIAAHRECRVGTVQWATGCQWVIRVTIFIVSLDAVAAKT
jgi:hypothetical protein